MPETRTALRSRGIEPEKHLADPFQNAFWREHAPPHFHALYAEHDALIDIRTLEVIGGKPPKRALSLTIEWAIEHRQELMEDWR